MQVAVYRNRNSRCCILLAEANGTVQYVSTEEDNGSLSTDVRKADAREFHSEYAELETYPVGRAIEHYTTPLTAAIRMSDRAAKALHKLSIDKAIAMNDQARMTLAERNVLATYHAGIKKTGPCPAVAPCATMEVVPGSSKKPKKGTWDKKETPTEANHDATVRAVRNFNEAQTKAAKKAARLEQKKRMNDTTNTATDTAQEVTPDTASKKPASKPAAKKAATTKKPATKEATPSKTNAKATKATKEKTAVNDKTKTTAAKKTTAKKEAPKAAKKATKTTDAKVAKGKAAPAAKGGTKLVKGTGKAATAAKGAGKAAPAAKGKGGATKAQKKPAGDAGRRGRKGAFDESQKIKVLVKDNPKREGTASYDTFEALRKSKTVGDFFAAGGASHNLHWNIERGYIEVV